MEIVFLLTGLITGAIASWYFAKSRFTKTEGIPLKDLEAGYVQKSIFEQVNADNKEKNKEINLLNSRLAQFEEKSKGLEERIENHKNEIVELQEKMGLEFKNLSNQIFEEKSSKFLELNEKKVFDILNPLKEKIQDFEKKVEENYKEETRERISLKKELEIIVRLNQQVSEDTLKLTNALKGDKKMQGDWGEIQLELILTRAGLEKDIHYRKQETFRDDDGSNQRPDYVINLPEEKNLIVDSKVSLIAYEQFFNEDNDKKKEDYSKIHLQNINKHINELGAKNYQNLYGINPPDYVLLFVPIEPALYIALKEDNKLFERALDRNIVLVSTSTLLATLRTISYIWKQDNQKKNVVEIARESGALYDKFVGFMENLIDLGKKIDGVKSDYAEAMGKLFESRQKGGTIIGRIERIKKLGADTTKSLPQNILDRVNENDPDE
ncbi:MAG TPA: DNA recombination protein RmuC [Chitinophagaceae bacterium]|nr:DNA recombination protein RmuC [Chitinophagaceae bacterium]